jgi:hypothetical protein
MAEFMFVNLNDPTQNKRRGVRKLVRSHVSCVQHSQKRIELGDVRKQSQSRYTDRSVNAWELLDDSKAGQLSQLSANAASDVDSSLLTQHHTTLPGLGPIRCLRQVPTESITCAAYTNTRWRRPWQKGLITSGVKIVPRCKERDWRDESRQDPYKTGARV